MFSSLGYFVVFAVVVVVVVVVVVPVKSEIGCCEASVWRQLC